jgi:hypothetical protein
MRDAAKKYLKSSPQEQKVCDGKASGQSETLLKRALESLTETVD